MCVVQVVILKTHSIFLHCHRLWWLLPVSLLPMLFGRAGLVYAGGALLLGFGFVLAAWAFVREKSNASARRVLHASLLYLPLVLALLLIESWIR